MKVDGQLKGASLEVLSEDPANQPIGRVWLNKAVNKLKVKLNAGVASLLTTADLITTELIGNGQITTDKLANDSVQTTKIGDSQVTTDKIANLHVTAPKIADGAIGPSKLSQLNKVISTSSGYYVNNVVGPPPYVTNLSCTITTSGRPVRIMLIPDGTSSGSSIGADNASNGTCQAAFYIDRNGTAIGVCYVSKSSSAGPSAINLPPSALQAFDEPPAGTHTYKIATGVISGNSAVVNRCKLLVVEE